jgi:hypothetical protein
VLFKSVIISFFLSVDWLVLICLEHGVSVQLIIELIVKKIRTDFFIF